MTKMLSKTRESTSVSSENPACGKVECLGFYCFFQIMSPSFFGFINIFLVLKWEKHLSPGLAVVFSPGMRLE